MQPSTAAGHRYLSPLRYPGGKARLAPALTAIIKENKLAGAHYVEPYAGGAGVALALLFSGLVKKIHINDIDQGVYAFWHSVLFATDDLCRLIRNKRISLLEWERQRSAHQSADTDQLHRGFATFYLNRTNRSGIVCSGGVIGGRAQDGEWTMAARYNKTALVRRIERVASVASQICVYNCDATTLVSTLGSKLPQGSIWYLDPPYYVKGKRRLYANFYEHEDHAGIAGMLKRSGLNWIVTYDDAKPIRDLYGECPSRRYRISYSAHGAYYGSEIMCIRPGLIFPPCLESMLKKPRGISA